MLSPSDARKLADTMTRIEKSVTNINKMVADALKVSKKDVADLSKDGKEFTDNLTKGMSEFQDQIERTVPLMTSGFTDMGSTIDHVFSKAKDKLVELERTPFFKFFTGNTQGPGAISGKSGAGIVGGLQDLRDKLFAGIPGGGIISLMIFGSKQDEDFRVGAAKISATMLSTSTNAMSAVGQVQQRLKDLKGTFTDAEYSATFKTLASSGLRLNEVMAKTPGFVESADSETKNFGKSLNEALMAADTLFNMQEGQAGKTAASMVEDTGVSLEQATLNVHRFGRAIQDTGGNVATFFGMLDQAGSALRMQRQGTTDLAQAYMSLGDSMRKANPGASDQYISKSATQALGNLAGGIADMPDDFKNYMMMKEGHGSNSLKNLHDYDTSSSGQDTHAFITHLNTMLQMAKEAVGTNKDAQYQYLLKQFPNIGKIGAQGLLDFNSAQHKGMKPEEAYATMTEEMRKAFGDKGAQVNEFEKLAEQIKIALGDLGNVFVTAIAGLLKILTYGFAALIYAATHKTDIRGAIDIAAAGFSGLGDNMVSALGKAAGSLKGAGVNLGSAYTNVAGDFSAPFSDEGRKKIFDDADKAREEKKRNARVPGPDERSPLDRHASNMIRGVPGTSWALDIKVINRNSSAEVLQSDPVA